MARGHLISRALTALDHVGTLPTMQRFAAHLSFELPALFGFLFDPAVDATNWRAEQALRPTVVKLQVNGGNRSARGAETQHVLTSVVRPRSNAGSMPSRSWSISYAPRTHGLPPPHLATTR